MDVTPQSIRSVQFREKLRGYHPDDVDAFVASVAKTVEELEARAKQAEARLAELETRQAGATEAEDSLRRTLVLAQRTADAAIQDARAEAARIAAESAQQREAAEAELAQLRARLHDEAEQERRFVGEQLVAERAALQADIEALTSHLERERERLRIYFADQLRRVDEGTPGVSPPPPMQAPDAPAGTATAPNDDADAGPGEGGRVADAPGSDGRVEAEGADGGDGAERSGAAGNDDEDPFLAELRRAVSDDRPLGPRDDEPASEDEGETDDDGFDLFAKGDDDDGRFGRRRRR